MLNNQISISIFIFSEFTILFKSGQNLNNASSTNQYSTSIKHDKNKCYV